MISNHDTCVIWELVERYGVPPLLGAIDEIDMQKQIAAQEKLLAQTKVFRGDSGMVRQALLDAGFECDGTMFNDNSSDYATRRIKIWFANYIVFAPLYKQERLALELRNRFGKRLLKMESIVKPQRCGGGRSLIIRLSNTPAGIAAAKRRSKFQPK